MKRLTLEVTIDYEETEDRLTIDVLDRPQCRTVTTYKGGQSFTDERDIAKTLTSVIGGGITDYILRFRRDCNK